MSLIANEDYAHLARVTANARQPEQILSAVADVARQRLGFGLLTMLKLTPDGDEVQRIFTTDQHNYPVSGRERLGLTDWGRHVLIDQRPFLGPDEPAVSWAFPADCDLIFSLGLGSTMNLPVTALGKTLGSLNILHAVGQHGPIHLEAAMTLIPYLAVPFLAAGDPDRALVAGLTRPTARTPVINSDSKPLKDRPS